MEYKYDLKDNVLIIGKLEIPPYSLEENIIGVCSTCESNLVSVSYHSSENNKIIVGRCSKCEMMYANLYDVEWSWLEEAPISQFFSSHQQNDPKANEDIELLENIPLKQLSTIFSATEIDVMFAKARGEKYIRQYLYRARKKYPDFEEVFGIKLQV